MSFQIPIPPLLFSVDAILIEMKLIRTSRKLSEQNIVSLLDGDTLARELVIRRETGRMS